MRTQTAMPPVGKEARNGKGESALTVSHKAIPALSIWFYYSIKVLNVQVSGNLFYALCANHASTSPKTCARPGSLKTS